MAYYALDSHSPNYFGQFGGIWVPNNLIFTMLVLVSNMKILISSFRINIWIILLVLVSVFLYFMIYTLQS